MVVAGLMRVMIYFPFKTYALDSKTHKKIWYMKRNVRNSALKSLEQNGIKVEVKYMDVTQQKLFIVSNTVYDALKMYYSKTSFGDLSVGEFVKHVTE